ncbi:MAG: hypothetical protein NVS2B14_07360 [Chamaesiphon sp.]
MTWRGEATAADRIFACLPYLLPLFSSLWFGGHLLQQFPILRIIFFPVTPLIIIEATVPFASLIIFFVLYLAVVQNQKISYFIRFNTMQAILIDIFLFLCRLALTILVLPLRLGLLTETLFNLVFIGTLAVCLYSVVQSLLGRYAEIPALSEAVHAQVH